MWQKIKNMLQWFFPTFRMTKPRLERIEKQLDKLDKLERRIRAIEKSTEGILTWCESNLNSQQQPRLSYLILSILDHFNLRCKGCGHFANIAEKYFVPFETIKSDLQQMLRITKGAITRMSIMGGEPLLHPELPQIMSAARQLFPKTLIQVASNGVLLLRQKDEFWASCKDNNIEVIVTKYPLNLNYGRMQELANSAGVRFSFRGRDGFTRRELMKFVIDPAGLQNARRSFFKCNERNASSLLMEGRFYICPISCKAMHMNHKFGYSLELEEGDYLDIYKVQDASEILSFICSPVQFCRFCNTDKYTFSPWERSKQDISEWI